MDGSKGEKFRISDAARNKLEAFYELGMVGSGAVYDNLIDEAVQQTGLLKKQVKVRKDLFALQQTQNLVVIFFLDNTLFIFNINLNCSV